MRVAIIGNSHVAMLKHASDADPPAGWTPVYFAAPHRMMAGLAPGPDGAVLRPGDARLARHLAATSGGLREIDLAAHDAFVCVGLTVKVQTAQDLFADYQPERVRVSAAAQPISEAAFAAAVADRYATTPAPRLLRALARTGKPVCFVPSPFPNESLLDDPSRAWCATAPGMAALNWMNGLCRGIWGQARLSCGARVLDQPPATVGPSGLTLRRFHDGARGMAGQDYAGRDANHMNALFGRIVLDQIGAALATWPGDGGAGEAGDTASGDVAAGNVAAGDAAAGLTGQGER